MLKVDQQKTLLDLARDSIQYYLDNRSKLSVDKNELPAEFKEERGTFVTLTLKGKLKGCIGHIEPVQALYLDVIDNAINAAFKDPRFSPLIREEFDDVKIEISVLSQPVLLEYADADDLLKKLRPEKDGVIIRQGFYSATFLPQVWEQISNPEDFLAHLCTKAGLSPYAWKTDDLEVKVYTVESFEEY